MATKPQTVKVMVFLKKSQVQRLDAIARKSAGTNRSVFIREAIDYYLRKG
ncbi:MAG: ribbon-helix-helix protein, CopG family [Nitrospirae bacterium]|nr:ribbon-helix-helix protein, CopG family [Nitrospirota bacterium]